MILIDTREQRLYDILSKKYSDLPISLTPLEIGDIHIVVQDNPSIVLVLERKTVRDLSASIKDGRYREQKVRMSHSYLPHHCTYIIENGNAVESWMSTPEMSETAYMGAIIHTMYRDKMHVVVVQDISETARYISILYQKVKDHPEKFVGGAATGDNAYMENVKVKKRKIENIDPKTCYLMQWCQIPGISHKIATEICKVYPSWQQFYEAVSSCATEGEKHKLLQNIPMLGSKKVATILEYTGTWA